MSIVVSTDGNYTVYGIVSLALKDINVLAPGEELSSEDAADALATLNMMLSQWQVQKMMVYGQRVVSFNCDGSQTYTIGPSATVNTALPTAIDSATYLLSDITYPVSVIDSREDYENITLKTIAGTIPSAIFFQRDWPQGTVYVWPQPAGGSMRLVTKDVLSSYAGMSDEIAVPPEYALPMRMSLAELLANTYGKTLSVQYVQQAKQARKVMKRNNLNIPLLGQPQELLNNGRFSIYTGQ